MITRLRRRADSLAVRVSAILAVVLLPVGVIAFAQTAGLLRENRAQSETSLLALTSEAASAEEGLMRTGFGVAETIAALAPKLIGDGSVPSGKVCDAFLNDFVSASDQFSFAGYVGRDGRFVCSSNGTRTQTGMVDLAANMAENPAPHATVNLDAPFSKTSVIVVAHPVWAADGTYMGYTVVSLPHYNLFRRLEKMTKDRPIDLITFNREGETLSSENGFGNVEARIPAGRPLSSFVGGREHAFTAMTMDGQRRVFAFVPIIPGLVYGLGSWDAADLGFTWNRVTVLAQLLFPVLMWVASLVVAYVAIRSQVIQPTRNLRARMLLFMRSRRLEPTALDAMPAAEFREIEETWNRLANSILRDEAELEDAIHDKTVLLREVHHRVKNNLQLVSSILNMKIRKARTEDVRDALRNIQGRVLGIATVHRNLYETSMQGRVRGDELIKTIAQSVIAAGRMDERSFSVKETFEPLIVYPDQAVPLSLVTSEALGNAMKYAGAASESAIALEVCLRKLDEATGVLEIRNTKGPVTLACSVPEGTGLGTQLIAAFTAQLDGALEVEDGADAYVMRITFPLKAFEGDAEATAQ
ncbi:histidine kinase dimerization/phosphoacceptor domain -containing protein [Celeribacter sp.]|uniref:histidine kinase dimerization/phosphoacceptor domain -containing protein n=1 Tax=Celeribacter sp. TaxID=1890673 RepID=UPI003A92A52F